MGVEVEGEVRAVLFEELRLPLREEEQLLKLRDASNQVGVVEEDEHHVCPAVDLINSRHLNPSWRTSPSRFTVTMELRLARATPGLCRSHNR